MPRKAALSISEKLDKYGVPIPECGCVIWVGGIGKAGYGILKHKKITMSSHRASYIQKFGDIPKGKYVCHSCDNRACINPDHLFVGTHSDNMADMVKKGRSPRYIGENNPMCKLTEWDVVAILLDDRKRSEIAEAFNIHTKTIYKIKSGKLWKLLHPE